MRAPGETLIVLDCGTGAHDLGQALLASGEGPIRGHLLITHTHWDHIQGFPFFAPLIVPGNTWDVYAPQGLGRCLEETLAGQMEYAYSPLTLGQLGATIRYHDLVEGGFDLGPVRVTARYLNHPGAPERFLRLAYARRIHPQRQLNLSHPLNLPGERLAVTQSSKGCMAVSSPEGFSGFS